MNTDKGMMKSVGRDSGREGGFAGMGFCGGGGPMPVGWAPINAICGFSFQQVLLIFISILSVFIGG
jgi:hypothetical protein